MTASKNIHLICAARPNFMKVAPLYLELKKQDWCQPKIVHTGQHYDHHMSQAFFDDFNLPKPHFHLGIGSGTHAEQTAQTMVAYEKLCIEKDQPDLVIVVGDVNATMACTIAAKKLYIKVAHIEAGLRSFDRSMPEEINRVLTDSVCDYHLTPSQDANENLIKEGIDPNKIFFVGNIMIDSYLHMESKIRTDNTFNKLKLSPKDFVLLTLHRPANVDSVGVFRKILDSVGEIDKKVIFPVHPRTKKIISQIGHLSENITLIDPLSYVKFMNLVTNASFIVTDSGGMQEETTYLGIPCFTLRENTERPITLTEGTNTLVNSENLYEKINFPKKGKIPNLWDGKTSKRIKKVIKDAF